MRPEYLDLPFHRGTWGGILIIAIARLHGDGCVSTGPVVVRLAGMAFEREREHNHCYSTAGMHPCIRVEVFFSLSFWVRSAGA